MRGFSLLVLLTSGCLSAPGTGGGDPEDNLLPNGDFEAGTAGWSSDAADLYDDGEPRSGAASMSACVNLEPLPDSYLVYPPSLEVPAGDYRAEVWVKRQESSNGQLVWLTAAAGEQFEQSQMEVAGDAWIPLTLRLKLPGGLVSLALFGQPELEGDCIYIDDAWLVRE